MNKHALLLSACCLVPTVLLAAPKRPKNDAPVDPAIAAIAASARANHARFEQIKHTMKKWGPHTNVVARLARQSTMEKLTETRAERDQAKAEAKSLKDMQKAARKFGKNIEKVRKDFEKYRAKAATEDERDFWQSLLDIVPVPN